MLNHKKPITERTWFDVLFPINTGLLGHCESAGERGSSQKLRANIKELICYSK